MPDETYPVLWKDEPGDDTTPEMPPNRYASASEVEVDLEEVIDPRGAQMELEAQYLQHFEKQRAGLLRWKLKDQMVAVNSSPF